ncbi:MAG: hypothetical protein WAN51_06725, partial [Alphaproteobacteria bacterium]
DLHEANQTSPFSQTKRAQHVPGPGSIRTAADCEREVRPQYGFRDERILGHLRPIEREGLKRTAIPYRLKGLRCRVPIFELEARYRHAAEKRRASLEVRRKVWIRYAMFQLLNKQVASDVLPKRLQILTPEPKPFLHHLVRVGSVVMRKPAHHQVNQKRIDLHSAVLVQLLRQDVLANDRADGGRQPAISPQVFHAIAKGERRLIHLNEDVVCHRAFHPMEEACARDLESSSTPHVK